jgi:hypothetical protein
VLTLRWMSLPLCCVSVVAHYTTMIKSVQSLRDRIAVLHQFLLDVQSGQLNINANGDQQILREIKGLCLRLPVMNQEQFRSDLLAVRIKSQQVSMRSAEWCVQSADGGLLLCCVSSLFHRSTTMRCW